MTDDDIQACLDATTYNPANNGYFEAEDSLLALKPELKCQLR